MMTLSKLKYLPYSLLLFCGLIPSQSIKAQESPLDLILAVDISYSMTWNSSWNDGTDKTLTPADPEGKRWDGLQFLVDTAGDNDRIAIILFQHKAEIATTQLAGEGGFVPVKGEGRKKLKALIARFKEIETQSQLNYKKDNNTLLKKYDNLPGEKGNFDIELDWKKGGTSNFNALKLASTNLVPLMRREADHRLILFTDGADSDIKTSNEIKQESNAEKKKKYIEERNNYLNLGKQLVQDLGKQKIPMFVFGLGDDCDDELLTIFVLESRPKDSKVAQKIGYSEYFKAKNNVQLFEKLRQVGWELRQRWPVPLEQNPISGGIELKTPNLLPFSDFGILLFSQKDKSSIAPDQVVLKDAIGAEELTSSSHTYLRFPKGEDTIARVEVFAKNRIEHYAAAGTSQPLFIFRSPKLDQTYSPLDMVPLEVEFNADAGKGFSASQFEVAVELIKSDGTNPFYIGSNMNFSIPLRFDLKLSSNESGLFQYLWVPHQSWRTEKPNYSLIKGRWDIRVFLSATSGPLKGAKRELFLKQFELTDYPKFEIVNNKLEVNNLSINPKPGYTPVPVRFNPPLKNPPKGILSTLTQSLKCDRKDLRLPFDKKVNLITRDDGEISVPHLDLSTIDWPRLKPSENVSVQFSYSLPWQNEPVSGTVTIVKKRYPVILESSVIRFYAEDKNLKGTVLARLETDLPTEEEYYLSGDNDSAKPEGEIKLRQVKGTNKDKLLSVKIKNGRGTLFGGADRQQARVLIEIVLDSTINQIAEAEVYQGHLYLHGTSLESQRIPIEIVREAIQIEMRVRGEEWIPISLLRFPALAGTKVDKEFRFTLRVNTKSPLEVVGNFSPDALTLISNENGEKGGTIPASAPASKTPNTRSWSIQIPPSVVEGIYGTELKFDLQSQGKLFQCKLPTEIQVSHYAIKAVDLDNKPLLNPEMDKQTHIRVPKESGASAHLLKFGIQSESRSPHYRIAWDCEILPTQGTKEEDWLKRIKLSDAISNQSVLKSNQARTIPLYHDAENKIQPRREIRVEIPTEGMAPGRYTFRVRVNSKLEIVGKDKDNSTQVGDASTMVSAPYEIPFEFIVSGRQILGLKTDLKELALGSKLTTEIKIKCFGVSPGMGSLTAPDDHEISEIALRETEKKEITSDEIDYTFKGEYTPKKGGYSRLKVVWPKFENTLPDSHVLTQETSVEVGGVLLVEPSVVLPGESIKLRLSLTSPTVEKLKGVVTLHARRLGSNDNPIEVTLYDSGRPESGDSKAGDGEFSGFLRCPGAKGDLTLMGKYEINWPAENPLHLPLRSTTSTDPNAKLVRPPMFYIGLDRSGEEQLGTISYDTGFFGWLPLAETSMKKENIFVIKNYGPSTCRYRVTILYPNLVPDSRNILNRDPALLDQTKDGLVRYDEKRHLLITLSSGSSQSSDSQSFEGQLAIDEELPINLFATLSEDANKAWREKKPHESLRNINGAIIKVELLWNTPDGETWSRTLYHRVQISTESFLETKGLAYGLSLFGILLLGGFVLFLFLRRRKHRQLSPINANPSPVYDDPLLGGGGKSPPSSESSPKPSQPLPPSSLPDDYLP